MYKPERGPPRVRPKWGRKSKAPSGLRARQRRPGWRWPRAVPRVHGRRIPPSQCRARRVPGSPAAPPEATTGSRERIRWPGRRLRARPAAAEERVARGEFELGARRIGRRSPECRLRHCGPHQRNFAEDVQEGGLQPARGFSPADPAVEADGHRVCRELSHATPERGAAGENARRDLEPRLRPVGHRGSGPAQPCLGRRGSMHPGQRTRASSGPRRRRGGTAGPAALALAAASPAGATFAHGTKYWRGQPAGYTAARTSAGTFTGGGAEARKLQAAMGGSASNRRTGGSASTAIGATGSGTATGRIQRAAQPAGIAEATATAGAGAGGTAGCEAGCANGRACISQAREGGAGSSGGRVSGAGKVTEGNPMRQGRARCSLASNLRAGPASGQPGSPGWPSPAGRGVNAQAAAGLAGRRWIAGLRTAAANVTPAGSPPASRGEPIPANSAPRVVSKP